VAPRQREVALVDLALFAEHGSHGVPGSPGPRGDEHARGLHVEAVTQPRLPGIVAHPFQLRVARHERVGHRAGLVGLERVTGHRRRLVDEDERLVLVQDVEPHPVIGPHRHLSLVVVDLHHLAQGERVALLRPPPTDP